MAAANDELLEKAHWFDMQALTEIYDLFSPGIYRYALRLLGDPLQAEDCVADTFSRFLHALKQGGGPRNQLQAYLYRIAHNWITDRYRREPLPPLELGEQTPASSGIPDEAGADVVEQARLRAALFRLTPEQRQVVVLKFVEGWENEAIAEMMKKPLGAVKALQHRALGALKRWLLAEEKNK